MEKKYYKRLDFIRLLSCIGVFLYHLNILKGGYLAVCTFFVMTGYLSVISAMSKEKFSLKQYYISRIKKIYLPLLIVVFSSIAILSLLNLSWTNLKPETTSVILGYNNFWQINANLDYFVRNVSSPFTHFWYIAILLQFELVFPLLFIIFKKIGNKIGKIIPCLFFTLLGIASFIFFCVTLKDGNIVDNPVTTNNAYFGTLTRAFSILFGVALGFFHSYYRPITFKNKNKNTLIFSFYIIITILMYFLIDKKFCSFSISMLAATFLSMRLIDYAAVSSKKTNTFDKIVASLSNISYEIYLVQYPVIYAFQNLSMNNILKIFLIIVITVLLSYMIHIALKFKRKFFTMFFIGILLLISMFGAYKYIAAKDYSKEKEELEKKLNDNSKLIEEQKKKYLENKKNKEDEWKKILEDYDAGEEKLKETVHNMQIVGIGDSIMELAVRDLYKQFPNGYFDAKTNRTEIELNGILSDLKEKDMLPDIIVLNIGTNGSWSKKRKEEMLEIIGDRKIFWLNATNPDYAIFNDYLIEFAESHDNVYIIDWISVAKDKQGILIYDGVHPTTPKGCKLYSETIYNAIYDYYLDEYNKKKEEMIKQHEELENQNITFIGNELLLGTYDYLGKDFSDSEFIIDKGFTFNSLKEKIASKIEDNTLSHNVVLMLDKNINITKDNYDELITLLNNYKLYIVDIDNKLDYNNENVEIIDFISELNKNDKYMSFDKIHLTEDGNKALHKLIIKIIKKEQ